MRPVVGRKPAEEAEAGPFSHWLLWFLEHSVHVTSWSLKPKPVFLFPVAIYLLKLPLIPRTGWE